METVFITIHDLSLDARIRYCSDSITDILGYRPGEVKGKSCWEYFHPDEIPFAKEIESKDLHLDTAASLKYCRIKHKDGTWIGCECVFTVVHDVLVASTAIYKRGSRSERRANDGANVRRIFSSSPRDSRYHMLGYLADNFTRPVQPRPREPRAAFILNRFSRTSTIMFATNGVEQILGLKPSSVIGKSFYHCIAASCLNDAVRVLESAKGNDSIAYMRFFFRDPARPDAAQLHQFSGHDDSEAESEDGGAPLSRSSRESSLSTVSSPSTEGVATPMESLAVRDSSVETNGSHRGSPPNLHNLDKDRNDSTDSGNSTNGTREESIFDDPVVPPRSSESSFTPHSTPPAEDSIEVEAVISCTSDGLVVVLRSAHEIKTEAGRADFNKGIFASPWATDPILPQGLEPDSFMPNMVFPPQQDAEEAKFMGSIKEIAVFAWTLTGINGSILDHATGSGKPMGEALPPGGLPVWDPTAPAGQNEEYNGFSESTHRPIDRAALSQKAVGKLREVEPAGNQDESSGSDDEVVWKRVPQIPAYTRPKRKASCAESSEESDGGVPLHDRRRRKLANGGRQNST